MAKTPKLLVHPELLESLMKHEPKTFEEMAGLLSMLTGIYAAGIANSVVDDEDCDPTTAKRRNLITSQMEGEVDRLVRGEPVAGFDWAADLFKYINADVEELLVRASGRQLRVFEGKHKPFSATRGKGFGS